MRWLIGTLILIAVAIVGISIYLQPNSFLGCAQSPSTKKGCQKADAIVVVSGGDTQARTGFGIELFKRGWADYLVLSGAALDTSGPSNAAAMKLQAQGAGVPEESILIDEESMNTQENAEKTKSIIQDRNVHDVILVTSGYHQRRASLEFNKIADGNTVRNAPAVDSDWDWYWWATPRGWWLAGSELVKIIAFYIGVAA
jgi:uncharacterized SAM-binding protein YcdF (DUF218 family)